jgi:hypothetical protein
MSYVCFVFAEGYSARLIFHREHESSGLGGVLTGRKAKHSAQWDKEALRRVWSDHHMRARTGNFSLALTSALFLSSPLPALAISQNFHNAQSAVTDATTTTGTCTTGAEAYSVSTTPQATSSTSFSNVNGTTVSFNQGAAGCVEVSFSSEALTSPNEILLTQAVLDGSTVCTPGDNLFASPSSGYPATHAMNYICPNVSAGNHSVTVQFASRYGSRVQLYYHTTIVRYAP